LKRQKERESLKRAGVLEKLNEIKKDKKNLFVVGQFENPDNPKAHYFSTGPEMWEQLNHHVDILVAGVGTGGTLASISRFLKERNPKIIIAAVEPKNASALLGHQPELHRIDGIGDGFIPSIIDEVSEVTDEDAIHTSRRLVMEIELLVGTSSGANVWAAMKLSEKFGKDKVIATILADRADISAPI
jgi:cysteine synthase A